MSTFPGCHPNHLIAKFNAHDLRLQRPNFAVVAIKQGYVICDAGDEVGHLGVQRASIAGKLQKHGVVSLSFSPIQILDRPKLEEMSCECYQSLIDQSASLGRHLGIGGSKTGGVSHKIAEVP